MSDGERPAGDGTKPHPQEAWKDHNGLIWVYANNRYWLTGWSAGISEDHWREGCGGPSDPNAPVQLLTREQWEQVKFEFDKNRPSYEGVLAALDRCEHGRHKADNCWSCPDGQSTGNLFLTPGTRIGTTLYGQPIIAPDHDRRGHSENWVAEGRVR